MLFTLGTIVLFSFGAGVANAYVQFNTDPQDHATFRGSNYTDCPGCTNWTTSVSADPGDTISFTVYYHNTGTETANNVRIKVSPQTTSTGTNFTFTGSVSADNSGTVSGSVPVTLSGSQSISYIAGSASWFPNQSTTGQPISDSALFTTGIPIGNIASGWNSQGQLRVQFKVSSAIIIIDPHPCVIDSFTGPSSVTSGSPATLSWSTTNCSTVSISGDGISGNYPVDSSVTSNALYGTTNFTLSATGDIGSPTANWTVNVNQQQTYQCNDGIDNDGDGYVDYPSDPDCTSYSDYENVYNGQNNSITVTTDSATSTGNGYATLNGYVSTNGTSVTRWFEWGTSYSLGSTSYVSGTQSWSGSFNYYLSGLNSNAYYYYKACAQSTSSFQTVCGSTVSFYTGNGNNYSLPSVSTQSASSILSNSATLNGSIDNTGNDYYSMTRSFKWGTSSTYLPYTLSVSGTQSWIGQFSQSLGGLSAGTTYYYQACAQNSYGQSCGATYSFTTTGSVIIQSSFVVVTTAPTSVTQTSARLNGLLNGNTSGAATGWFEWGSTVSLGNRTNSQSLGSVNSINFYDTITGLSPNSFYYFRAAVQGADGSIAYGDFLSLKTLSNTTPTQPVVIVSGTGTGSSSDIQLSIDTRYENVYVGDTLDYTVIYKNISKHTLTNGILRVLFPQEVSFRNSSTGSFSDSDNALTITIGTMSPGQTATYFIQGTVLRQPTTSNLAVTTANLVYTDTNSAQKEATAYELNTVGANHNSLLGLAIFGSGFLPTTLLGWLVLLLLIFVIVYLARRFYLTRGTTTPTA